MNQLPNDVETEKQVLGAMFIDKEAVGVVRDVLSPQDFYNAGHAEICKAVLSVFGRGDPVDDKILVQELRKRGSLEKVGGATYLAELAAEVATAGNVEYHAKIVLDLSRRRKAIAAAQKLGRLAGDPMVEIDGVLGETSEHLSALQKVGEHKKAEAFANVLTIGDLMGADYERPVSLLERTGDPPILTPHQTLVLGADRGGGKTVSCLNIGMCLASGLLAFGTWKPERPITVFYVHAEAENPYFVKEQLSKMLSDHERVSGGCREAIAKHFHLAVGADLLGGGILDVTNGAHQNLLSQVVRDLGAELLILDPLYWIMGGIDVEKAQDMQGVGKALRSIANLAGCAVLATTHFNKAGHIAGSYALQGFASTIIELQQLNGYEDFGQKDVGVYITKARNGWPRDGRSSWHVVLNPDTLWYDATIKMLPAMDELKGEKTGRRRQYRASIVVDILDEQGELSYGAMTRAIVEKLACAESTAKSLIAQAKRQGLVRDKGRMLTLERPF